MTRAILSTAYGCLLGVRELLLVALGGLPRERIDEVIRERDEARADCAEAIRQRDVEIDARRGRWS